jgi:gluconolactonase
MIIGRIALRTTAFFAAAISVWPAAAAQTMADLLPSGATPTRIVTGLISPEGPACDSSGVLYYCDFIAVPDNQQRGKVYMLGAALPVVANINVPSGLAFDRENRLIISGQNMIWRREFNSATLTVLAQGDSLKQANDLTLTSQGGIFFTANNWSAESYVYYLSPQGVLSKKLLTYAGGANFPNGIEYWEEKGLLLVCLTQKNCIMRYPITLPPAINPAGTAFCAMTGPDGILIDEKGNIWAAGGNQAVWVMDSTGAKIGEIAVGVAITNICLGGSDGKTLYITGGAGVYSIPTLVKGRKIPWTTNAATNPMVRRVRSCVSTKHAVRVETSAHGPSQVVVEEKSSALFNPAGKMIGQ